MPSNLKTLIIFTEPDHVLLLALHLVEHQPAFIISNPQISATPIEQLQQISSQVILCVLPVSRNLKLPVACGQLGDHKGG